MAAVSDGSLKNCPFCGARAEMCVYGRAYGAVCGSCGAEAMPRPSRGEAVAAWNRRAYEKLEEAVLDWQLRGYSKAECLRALERGMPE